MKEEAERLVKKLYKQFCDARQYDEEIKLFDDEKYLFDRWVEASQRLEELESQLKEALDFIRKRCPDTLGREEILTKLKDQSDVSDSICSACDGRGAKSSTLISGYLKCPKCGKI